MILEQVFERFVQGSPVSVMVRGTLENILHADLINGLFQTTAQEQYTRDLLFSTVVDTMTLVSCGIYRCPHAVYQDHKDWFPVSVTSLYNKLNGVELRVSAALVRYSATRLDQVISSLGGALPDLLPGYPVKILDGNCLAGTDHRLEELRHSSAAALPGKSLVVLDPSLMLAVEVFPCADGHTQERALLPAVLQTVQSGELWIEDRNFCTTGFLFGIEQRQAYFLVREHKGLPWQAVSKLRHAGRSSTGEVWEQTVCLEDDQGNVLFARRIVVQLDQVTRDGDTEVALLCNLWDEKVDAVRLAELYRQRWSIENLFQILTEALTCEHQGLGYPKAALFGFCTALVAYNVLAVVKAALRAVHGSALIEQTVSLFYLVATVTRTYSGMMIALPKTEWVRFGTLTASELALVLRELAAQVNLAAYTKHPRAPKKPGAKKQHDPKVPHVSTAKILAQRQQNNKANHTDSDPNVLP